MCRGNNSLRYIIGCSDKMATLLRTSKNFSPDLKDGLRVLSGCTNHGYKVAFYLETSSATDKICRLEEGNMVCGRAHRA